MDFKFAIIDKLYKDRDYEIYVVLVDGVKKIIKKIKKIILTIMAYIN